MTVTSDLPNFGKPPVIEVALSLQFNPIEKLTPLQFGILWGKYFRKEFERTESHPPLDNVVESFEQPTSNPGIRFRLIDGIIDPRYWFVSKSGTQLVQIQRDRFIHNWRKVGDGDHYPRYPAIKATFEKELRILLDFIKECELGEVVPNQCEVTYVNHILSGAIWKNHGELDKILEPWKNKYTDSFLTTPEDLHLNGKFRMLSPSGEPFGRLHFNADPAFRNDDKLPMLVLNFTARGAPITADIEGALRFFDLGREWIVRAFASITTETMHRAWERKN